MMRVRPANPDTARGLIDPFTKRALPVEGGDVPEDIFWTRRLLRGEVVRCDAPAAPAVEDAQPAGDEPVKPLTTR